MQNQTELLIARRIIRNGLRAGYLVSVYDGEEWPVTKSANRREIFAALASTDSDTVRFRNAEGTLIGDVFFVWGNGEDVLHDHSDKPEIAALVGEQCDGRQ